MVLVTELHGDDAAPVDEIAAHACVARCGSDSPTVFGWVYTAVAAIAATTVRRRDI